jgi:hypothetical protein
MVCRGRRRGVEAENPFAREEQQHAYFHRD